MEKNNKIIWNKWKKRLTLNIIFIKKSGFFDEVNLKKWDKIFNEWEVNNNLYIIESWKVSVEKYLNKNKKETKILWYLKECDIFWEWSLNNNNPKEVSIIACSNLKLLKINAKDWIELFFVKFPKEGFNLLRYIIDLTNKRLLESDKLLTSTYEMNRTISWIEKIDYKTIFALIDKFRDIVWSDYIIFIENNAVVEGYFRIIYDTRNNWRMSDKIVELNSEVDIVSKIVNQAETIIETYNLVVKLNVWNINIWYLILWKKWFDFSENDRKIIFSISNSISWIIRQKTLQQEQKNKDFMMD